MSVNEMKLIKKGTVTVNSTNSSGCRIDVVGFELGGNGTCRDLVNLACVHAIGVLQRELLKNIEEPGGGSIGISDRNELDRHSSVEIMSICKDFLHHISLKNFSLDLPANYVANKLGYFDRCPHDLKIRVAMNLQKLGCTKHEGHTEFGHAVRLFKHPRFNNELT